MPRENIGIILLALLLYAICGPVTLRDRILVATLHHIENKALVEPSATFLFEGALAGMTRRMNRERNDPYSTYIPPVEEKEYEESLENRFDGLGLVYRKNPSDQKTVVLYPILDSPAYKSGIRSGDEILSIDGQNTHELTQTEMTTLLQKADTNEMTFLLRRYGKSGTETVTVRRDRILRASVEGDRVQPDGKRVFRLETEPDIAYVRLTTFSDRSVEEMRKALKQIAQEKARFLVLDLRGNSGGYVAVSAAIAGFFLHAQSDHEAIVSTRRRDGKTIHTYFVQKNSQICQLPMAVLIDGDTASAAEILAAALQDYNRAVIVGSRSFGKGVVQEIFSLPLNSGTMQLTDASYWRPSNKNIHRAHDATDKDVWGVMPDALGLMPLSDEQRYATQEIRERRSNLVTQEPNTLLEDYVSQLPEEIKRYFVDDDETPDKTQKAAEPFVLQGNAPYYDPALDKAIDLLRGKND